MESVWEIWRQSSAMRIDLSSETKSSGSFKQVVPNRAVGSLY
jgi:hypothetical protein